MISLIHDNGGRPFKCIIDNDNNNITICKFTPKPDTRSYPIKLINSIFGFLGSKIQPPYYYENTDEVSTYELFVNELRDIMCNKICLRIRKMTWEPDYEVDEEVIYTEFLKYSFDKIFIGISKLNKMTKYSGGHGSKFDGNSILFSLKEEPLKYMFIGKYIFTFFAKSEIVEYWSPVGNNDVPYPYAIDINGNFYLMIEQVYLKLDDEFKDDPYDEYYKLHNILSSKTYPKSFPIYNEIHENISQFFIDDEEYNFSWVVDPSEDYDRLLNFKRDDDKGSEDSIISITNTDGNHEILTKERYINIMEAFGKKRGFFRMNITMICDRLW